MDTCSSGEDLTIKARKPYIITKQRERWTEEEHNRFLEAIKLYGRAWQRIEEHIGTKTAVQIRSHAQKFFTKLEKEALVKGIPAGQALDIEIPPPRPKRKPSNPFPRKTAVRPLSAEVETVGGKLPPSAIPGRQILNIDKDPLPEKSHGKENQGGDDCSSGIVNFGEEIYNSSITTSNENCIPIPVAPLVSNDLVYQNNNTFVAYEAEAEAKQEAVPVPVPVPVRLNLNHNPTNNITDSANSYPLPGQEKTHHSNILHDNDRHTNPAATCTTTDHPPFPAFHPFFSPPVCHNQDDFRSFFNMPTFWNLIISALLQNPAAHHAATLAATLWPIDNLESSPLDHPSMQAIVATTLAAATAWWAAHGLIPSCSPFTHNNHDKTASDVVEVKDRKPVDHSSCGSNASSSEIEIDALDKEVLPKEDNGDSLNRRCKNTSIITDSWKEVSEEGRVAFRALFSRQVLPQSFSYPPLDNVEYALRLGLNNSTPVVHDCMTTTTNNTIGRVNDGDQETMLDLDLGLNLSKLNNKAAGRRTGFKPYKRMMMVNSNGGGGQVGENTPKRICLEQKVLS